ncbi:murein DD-endopeptidase MepM/ murein hydrolase activator NlpD [Croceifilum oryzae]|uniref:Murein DD-endopeptidase MepM/ murein hydrolase activator NlpD n=1 Tax=Croceifilum oryzae TaxID=1553429 RepID=A0AAJ1TBR5_9BACL|nr:peptidoglycan DD-metalloendopeptidase family protein [Croceifilum oryzae]MDQ0415925.1 murein DD-endopeptidase MepM/ murein hydrolase activator NlpD [Croceifilum oryzae]
MKKRSWIALSSASVLIASILFSVQVSAENASKIQEKFKDAQDEKNKLQSQIDAKDMELKEFEQKREQIQGKIDEIQKDITPIEDKLDRETTALNKMESQYADLVSNMYEEGVFSPLAMLLQSKGFDDFIANLDTVKLIADRKYDLVSKIKEGRNQVKKQLDDLVARQNLQQQEVDKAKKLYLELVEAKKKDDSALTEANKIIEQYSEEMIDVNKSLIASGKLNFSYTGPMKTPINASMTSPFGLRKHPIYGRYIMHQGIDYPSPTGTPIYAAADGVVVSSRASSGYGWLLTIYHGHKNGVPIYSRYAHSYPNQIKARVGEHVTKGKQVTSVGANGQVTGAHLHFEVYAGENNAVNPTSYLQ